MIALIVLFWVILDGLLAVATVYVAYTAIEFHKKYEDSEYIIFAIFSVFLGLLTIGSIIAPFCI